MKKKKPDQKERKDKLHQAPHPRPQSEEVSNADPDWKKWEHSAEGQYEKGIDENYYEEDR